MLDRLSTAIGRAASWLTLFMVLTTFLVVVMRYVFDAGFIWIQESVVWMHAVVFMLGAAYTLHDEEHVRVDVFYRNMSARRRASWTGSLCHWVSRRCEISSMMSKATRRDLL